LALLVSANVTLCPLAGLFGVSCPSCGLTRATLALVEGDVARAAAIHPGVFIVWPYLFAVALGQWRALRFRSERARALGRRGLVGLGLVVMVALTLFWGARWLGAWGGPVPVKRWVDVIPSLTGRVTAPRLTR
jgi:hypothetical protein